MLWRSLVELAVELPERLYFIDEFETSICMVSVNKYNGVC
jgi:hypothetical protein